MKRGTGQRKRRSYYIDRVARQAGLVKALFECMSAFPLSHAWVVTDALTLPSPGGRGGFVPTKNRHKWGEGVYKDAAKWPGLVMALFECMPAFPLSHACIVTDKLQQIPPFDRLRTPLWVGEVVRPHP